MKHFLEKISILSLSLMLVSTFSVAPAVPAMMAHFAGQGYGASQVEFLITVTSFAIMGSLLLNPLYVRLLSERLIVSLALVLVALGGSLPVFIQSFPVVFVSRILLGLGLGMINARAINIIGLYFEGEERVQMYGLRGSAEVLGSASLTALVGLLLPFGWQYAFLIYLLALVILGLYLVFVPKVSAVQLDSPTKVSPKLSHKDWGFALSMALLAGFIINVNTAVTLKIPVWVLERNLGTASQASLVLSAMLLMGILAGLVFARLLSRLKNRLLPLAFLVFGLSIFGLSLAPSIWLLALSALCSGFCYSTVLTIVFSSVSARTDKTLIDKVMTIVLVFCNIGGATAAFVPQLLGQLYIGKTGAYGVYAGCSLVLALLLFFKAFRHKAS